MLDAGAPRIPVPWAAANNERGRSIMGADPWAFGIEANRATLNAFLDWSVEQGVCARRLEIEELFLPEVQERFAI